MNLKIFQNKIGKLFYKKLNNLINYIFYGEQWEFRKGSSQSRNNKETREFYFIKKYR